MNKIFTFVVNKRTNKLLLLLGNSQDPQYNSSFWYVVTGGVEDIDLNLEATVKREVKEETNLDIDECIYLNWVFKYTSLGIKCVEYVYVSFVENTDVVLNEESIDYKWCNIDDFIECINWSGNKELLRNVVQSALKKEIYIKEELIEESC